MKLRLSLSSTLCLAAALALAAGLLLSAPAAAKPCPLVYAPVCGTNGQTYTNECFAGNRPIECQGECPCEGTVAAGDALVLDPLTSVATPEAENAAGPCPKIWAPVCGENGRTYANECVAGNRPIACTGECPCPEAAAADGLLEALGLAPVLMAGPNVCPDIWAPVCGENGRTYPNECSAKGEIACQGECPCTVS